MSPNPSGGDIIQTKRPNLNVFRQKDANGIANSEDPDPVCSIIIFCPKSIIMTHWKIT